MKKIFLTLCCAFALIAAMSQDLSKMISSDAVMVAKINGAALNNKMSIEYLQGLEIMDEFMRELRSNPSVNSLNDLGINLSKNAYSFAEINDSMSVMYFLIPLKSKTDFEQNFLKGKRGYIKGQDIITDDDVIMTWNDNSCIIALGEINQTFMKDSLFRAKYGIVDDPFDYDYGYDNYDNYEYEETAPVYTEDGNYYYPETNYAEDAVEDATDYAGDAAEDAVDAAKDAAGDAIDAAEEAADARTEIGEYAPKETFWENGVEYYLNGEEVGSADTEIQIIYPDEEAENFDTDDYNYQNNNDDYYNKYDRYYEVTDSLTASWLLNGINGLSKNKSNANNLSADIKNTINSSSDASVFIDYGRVMNLYTDYLFGGSMNYYSPYDPSITSFMNMYKGMKMKADMTFAVDKMSLVISSILDDKNADLFEGMLDHKFNKKFLKHMDLDNALAYYSMSFNTEKVLEMYPKIIAQYMGQVPEMEGAGPAIAELMEIFIDEEAVAELLPGNATVICDGMTKQKMSYTSYDYDENFNTIETTVESEELLPSVLMMIESKNYSPIRKLIALTERFDAVTQTKYGFIIKPSRDLPVSTYVIFKNDIIFLCNDEPRMEKIVNGQSYGTKNKAHASKLKKNNMVAFVDGEKILENIIYAPQRENDVKSWELAKSSLKDMEIIQYQKNKNTIVTSMNVSTPAAVNNSWQYFWDTLNQFYKIETGK